MATNVNNLLKNFNYSSAYADTTGDIMLGEGTLINRGLKSDLLGESQKAVYLSRQREEEYQKKKKEEETKKIKNKLDLEYQKAKDQLLQDTNDLNRLQPGNKNYALYLDAYNDSVNKVKEIEKVKNSSYSTMKGYLDANGIGTYNEPKEQSSPQQASVQGQTKQQPVSKGGNFQRRTYPKGLGGGTKTPSQYFSEHGLDWNKDAGRIAKEAGIENYSGTANQNLQLVSYLENKNKGTGTEGTTGNVEQPKEIGTEEMNKQLFGRFKEDKTFTDDNMPIWLSEANATKIKSDRYSTPTRQEGMKEAIKNAALQQFKDLVTEDNKKISGKIDWLQKIGVMNINQVTPEMATKFFEQNKSYFGKEQVAKDEGVAASSVRDIGRQNLLIDIAEGKKTIGKDVKTTLSKDEERFISDYKSNKIKNAIKGEMNNWITKYNAALKISSEEGKKVKGEWKNWISQQRNINPEFKNIEKELRDEYKNMSVEEALPGLNVNMGGTNKKQGDTIDMGMSSFKVDKGNKDNPPPTTTTPPPTTTTPPPTGAGTNGQTTSANESTSTNSGSGSTNFNNVNNGDTQTLDNKIEKSNNTPEEKQPVIAPKNILKPN